MFTVTSVEFPEVILKLLGRTDLHPAKVQFDRFREYEPGLSADVTVPVTSQPLVTQLIEYVRVSPEPEIMALFEP